MSKAIVGQPHIFENFDLREVGRMNTYDYTYKGVKKKLTLSVNKDLIASARGRRINLSAFLENGLEEFLFFGKGECGGRDANPRIPTEQDLKSCAFVQLGYPRLASSYTPNQIKLDLNTY